MRAADAGHAGEVQCRLPWTSLRYRGHFEGATLVTDADGTVLGARDRSDGEGVVVAEVSPGRRTPLEEVPDRFWLHRRGALAALMWNYQRVHGRQWYARNGCRRPPELAP